MSSSRSGQRGGSGPSSSLSVLEEKAKQYIQADIRLLSGCRDEQTSADVKDVKAYYKTKSVKKISHSSSSSQSYFSLSSWFGGGGKKKSEDPEKADKSGGAFTACLLKVLYENTDKSITFHKLLFDMRKQLSSKKFTQIPQLSSSRCLNLSQPFSLTSNESFITKKGSTGSGTKHALMIGINYVGMDCELSGCHNDVHSVRK